MPSLSILLTLAVLPGSDCCVASTDYATSLWLPSLVTHAPVSAQWALPYESSSKLIAMPAPIETVSWPGGTLLQGSAYLGDPADPASLKTGPEDPLLTLSQYMPSPDQSTGPASWARLHDRTMGDLSLDWGLADIGPGVLTPQLPLPTGGRGLPGLPLSGQGSPQGVPIVLTGTPGSTPIFIGSPVTSLPGAPSPPIFLFPPAPLKPPFPLIPPPAPAGGPQPVPEPASVAVWLLGLALVVLLSSRWMKPPAVLAGLAA